MTLKASTEVQYKTFLDEIVGLMKTQEDFLTMMHMTVCECEAIDKAEETCVFFNLYIYIYSCVYVRCPPTKEAALLQMSKLRVPQIT